MWKFLERLRDHADKNAQRETLLKHGQELWNKLNEKLPLAKGIKSKDEQRLQQFREMVSAMSDTDRKALKMWLKYAIKDNDQNAPEHTTGKIEELIRKRWQIFKTHAEVLENL